MTGYVTQILRHPIKSHGREAVAQVTLTAGQTMPWDRVWAVAHDASDADGTQWAACRNFSRGAKAPGLQAITAELDETQRKVTLRHPDLGQLTFSPDSEGAELIAWSKPLIPEGRAASARVVQAHSRGMTDSDYPSVSLCNMASHRAVCDRVGRDLSIHRWRGNLWFDGLAEWQEFDWIDREVRIGTAVVIPRERTTRCLATHANPDTGARDIDMLATLDTWGHRDFSVLAEVVHSGDIALNDKIGLA